VRELGTVDRAVYQAMARKAIREQKKQERKEPSNSAWTR
jgi:hypothetical protein